MKLVKGFVFAIAGLSVMITLVSLLMPSKVMTVRSVVIHAGEAKVFDKITDLSKWKQWHPVFMQDSSSIRISNPSTGVNASASWNSNGKENKLAVTESVPYHIKAELSRTGENPLLNIISVISLKDSNNVQAEWRTVTKLKWYPWEKFSGIFIDKMTGPGYEAALNNLKDLVEGEH